MAETLTLADYGMAIALPSLARTVIVKLSDSSPLTTLFANARLTAGPPATTITFQFG